MTTQEIANKLVELCRKGGFEEAQTELFADNAVSIEQQASPDFPQETKGLKAIKEKSEKWNSMVKEIHGLDVSDPLVADNSFAVTMRMDVTMKDGNRMGMTELWTYHVKDGKVVSEEFSM